MPVQYKIKKTNGFNSRTKATGTATASRGDGNSKSVSVSASASRDGKTENDAKRKCEFTAISAAYDLIQEQLVKLESKGKLLIDNVDIKVSTITAPCAPLVYKPNLKSSETTYTNFCFASNNSLTVTGPVTLGFLIVGSGVRAGSSTYYEDENSAGGGGGGGYYTTSYDVPSGVTVQFNFYFDYQTSDNGPVTYVEVNGSPSDYVYATNGGTNQGGGSGYAFGSFASIDYKGIFGGDGGNYGVYGESGVVQCGADGTNSSPEYVNLPYLGNIYVGGGGGGGVVRAFAGGAGYGEGGEGACEAGPVPNGQWSYSDNGIFGAGSGGTGTNSVPTISPGAVVVWWPETS